MHIDAWTNLEPWNGGNDFGICQWRLINKFSALNKVKIYSEGSKGNKFFSFAKIKTLKWWIKTVIFVSNYQISIGKLLSEVHIDAWTTLEAWNGGNDFGICRWCFFNNSSVLNKVKIYSDGSQGNKIGDEIIWLIVISCYTRSIWSNIQLSILLLYEIHMVEHTTSEASKEEMLVECLNDAI